MMNHIKNDAKQAAVHIPATPTLALNGQQILYLSTEGEILEISQKQAAQIYMTQTPIVCHAPALQAKLGVAPHPCFDVLELFAFTHPTSFIIPTLSGLGSFYNKSFETSDDSLLFLQDVIVLLLKSLRSEKNKQHNSKTGIDDIISMMPNWIWSSFVANAINLDQDSFTSRKGFKVWKELTEWSEHAPEPPTGHLPISEEEAEENLNSLLTHMKSTPREAQRLYTKKASKAFHPREKQGKPNIVMAEAGTGTGKTLGYIAPAQSWAKKNEGQVWLSTYTKNLQKQINKELDKAYPDKVEKRRKTVIRKGRENYLCLLNFEELAKRASLPTSSIQAQLMAGILARWIQKTDNGDLKGGDLSGWIHDLFDYGRLNALSDQRGECIHAACPHFDKCFIEKNIRQSRHAEIVVANHALVMIQNALAGEFMDDLRYFPTRYVFDEAHHLFHAADNAFASHLSGRETYELRRWILGQEQNSHSYRSSRSRGLQARMDEFVKDDRKAYDYCQSIIFSARDLPAHSWLSRLHSGQANGATEEFLAQVKAHVEALQENQNNFYAIEAEKTHLPNKLLHSAKKLSMHLTSMLQASYKLYSHLEKRLNEESDTLEPSEKQKMEALSKSLKKRLINSLESWISMLGLIEKETPDDFLDWFVIERIDGHDFDYGFYRHWIDPMKPFIKSLENQSHGLVFTSATLTDSYHLDTLESQDILNAVEQQKKAENTIGLPYFHEKVDPAWLSLPSPFNYAEQARIFIINDLDTNNIDRVSDCYRALFDASNGGALGLFTSVQKLKAVYTRLISKIHNKERPLYAQHIDGMDISTLIDIFKEEKNSCLLGTDATRDGVDIPGESLRMLVFDKVPWPRPHMLHKARRSHFGAKEYDDRLTKMKLKQAFGRLIRTSQDKGVFVMLESRLPSRMLDAFPSDCPLKRCSLKEAIHDIQLFLEQK